MLETKQIQNMIVCPKMYDFIKALNKHLLTLFITLSFALSCVYVENHAPEIFKLVELLLIVNYFKSFLMFMFVV
jgi:hypothetical protein